MWNFPVEVSWTLAAFERAPPCFITERLSLVLVLATRASSTLHTNHCYKLPAVAKSKVANSLFLAAS